MTPGPNAGHSYPPPPLETRDTEPAPPMDRNFTPPPDTLRVVKLPWFEPNEPEADVSDCPNCSRTHDGQSR